MKYYTTGKGRNLNKRGVEVEVFEKTGESLVKRGILVHTKEELDVNPEVEVKETIRKDVLDAPEVITSKRKGNPNWTKKQ